MLPDPRVLSASPQVSVCAHALVPHARSLLRNESAGRRGGAAAVPLLVRASATKSVRACHAWRRAEASSRGPGLPSEPGDPVFDALNLVVRQLLPGERHGRPAVCLAIDLGDDEAGA